MKQRFLSILKPTFFLIFTLFLAVLLSNILFKFDNKYTMKLQPYHGEFVIDDDLLTNEVTALVDDWEFYSDVLLTPNDFNRGLSQDTDYVFIGQYPDFSLRDETRSPFGCATYRLTLKNMGNPRMMSLLIPSMYSSGKVYLDDEWMLTNGNPNFLSYQPKIKRNVLTFYLQEEVEIVIQVANYNHYYSGLYSPPLLGSPEAIANRNLKNITFYAFLTFSALSIFVYCCILWFKNRSLKIQLYLGLFCLTYIIYISHQLLAWIGMNQVTLLYAIIDAAFMSSLACTLVMITTMTENLNLPIYRKFIKPLSLFMIVLVFFIPLLLLQKIPSLMNLYGLIIDLYKYLCAFYSLFLIYYYHLKRRGLKADFMVYFVIAFFAMSLLTTLTSSNQFEPICFGWYSEYSSYLLVLLFMAYMIQINVRVYEENLRLTQHLKEEVEIRTQELTCLLNDRKIFLANIAHDLKAPLSAIQTYLEYVRQGNIYVDDEIKRYLEIIDHKSNEATSRVISLQKYTEAEKNIELRVQVSLNALLQKLYEEFKADMEANGIYFKLLLCSDDCCISGYPEHLNRAISNMLYNAMSFTPLEGHITLQLSASHDYVIQIQDDGSGIAESDLPHLFDRYYSSRLDGDNSGLGLHIAREIIAEHNGNIQVESKVNKGTIFTIHFKK